MIFHDVEQNTEEWLGLRCGRITSSKLGCVMANYGKAFGQPAKDYAVDLALEQIKGEYTPSTYTNDHMQLGHEEEPIARKDYEDQFFYSVSNGGFFELGDIGCSPDGLVGTDGVIEIKSAIPKVHYSRIVRQSLDPAYKWQLVGNLKFTGRAWIDFISYCSSFPDGRRLYVHRSHASDFKDEFGMVDERLGQFRELISDAKEQILNSNYLLIRDAA